MDTLVGSGRHRLVLGLVASRTSRSRSTSRTRRARQPRGSSGRPGSSAGAQRRARLRRPLARTPRGRRRVIAEDEDRRGAHAHLPRAWPRSTGSPPGCARAASGKGDAVGVFMPMCPEAVIAAYAIAKVGAIYVPLFSGFAAGAIAARLSDAEAKVVFTADGAWRRGKRGADEAGPRRGGAGTARRVRTVVVAERRPRAPTIDGPDVSWASSRGHDGPATPRTRAEDVLWSLHVGHDRQAEGRGPHARGLPRQDRLGDRLRDRRPARRRLLLAHRHGLDDGPAGDGRRARARRRRC